MKVVKTKVKIATILSAFLIVSVVFITPVNATILEKSLVEEDFYKKISDQSISFEKNQNIQNLIDLNNNDEIKNLMKKVLNPNNNEDVASLVNEYITILKNKGITQEVMNNIQSIISSYESDFNDLRRLTDCMDKKADSDKYKNYNYYIQKDNEEIKVTKKKIFIPLPNAVVVKGSDSSVYIPGIGLITPDLLIKLSNFFYNVSKALVAVAGVFVTVGDVLTILGIVLLAVGSEKPGTLVVEIAYYMLMISLIIDVLVIACMIISMILYKIAINLPDSLKQTKTNTLQIIKDKWKNILQRILRYQNKLRLQPN